MLRPRSFFGLSWKKPEQTLEGLHDRLPISRPNGVKAELAALKETLSVLKSLVYTCDEESIRDALQAEHQTLLRIYHSGAELGQQELRQFLLDILERKTSLAELAAIIDDTRLAKTLSCEAARLKKAVESISEKLEESYS